jgi:RNA polymerase sigma factor FliA
MNAADMTIPIPVVWEKYKMANDMQARDALISHYLHLVKYVVGRVAAGLPSFVSVDDLYSTGITGLIKAIERYDLAKKNKFETYAILVIKGTIIDELRALDWIPRSVHQKANQVGRAQEELQKNLGREATDAEIADHLGISKSDFEELLTRIRPAILIPLDAESSCDDEGISMAERIADERASKSDQEADRHACKRLLDEIIHEMPDQEKMVLMLYYYEDLMLKEIGKIMGISESRVSQIHTKAILRLRTRLGDLREEFSHLL